MSQTHQERFGMTEEEAKKLDLPTLQARFGNPVHDGNSPLHISWIRGRAEEHLVSLVGEQEAKRIISKACAKPGLIAENIQHEITVLEKANAYLAEVKARHEADQKFAQAIQAANEPPLQAATTTKPAAAKLDVHAQFAAIKCPIERGQFYQANRAALLGQKATK